MADTPTELPDFRDLKLPEPLLAALDKVGYESPSPIQALAIPPLLEGRDLLGRAPTGTGKTAAFALPLLARLDLSSKRIQVLVLTPTRELCIQVAEAFQRYGSGLRGFHVLPVYGGQDYTIQIRSLKRGAQIIVGTPGRVMDHMRRGTLKIDTLSTLVLDEADEMLRMGFLEDVEWVLEHAPKERQIALFSATMPQEIRRITERYLRDPAQVAIQQKTTTAETIRQRYWLVSGLHKLDALTRILEVESFDGMLLFVRTKNATAEIAERLQARGYAAFALNGDMPQKQRELVIEKMKRGSVDILVATDVAARGLDLDRISHVVNYDIPTDTEAYVHRIGRTGRAGRSGEAILFVSPRERYLLRAIEKATRQPIEPLTLPSTEMVNNKRIQDFKQKITDTLGGGELAFMESLVAQYQDEHDVPPIEIAAALAQMVVGDSPMLLEPDRKPQHPPDRRTDAPRKGKPEHGRKPPRADRPERGTKPDRSGPRPDRPPASDMERFRVEVGHAHKVKPGNLVGAIANEAGLDSRYIGRIRILDTHSELELPKGMPKEVFQDLKKTRVCGHPLNISRISAPPRASKKEPSED